MSLEMNEVNWNSRKYVDAALIKAAKQKLFQPALTLLIGLSPVYENQFKLPE
jgi:hypothetical protein